MLRKFNLFTSIAVAVTLAGTTPSIAKADYLPTATWKDELLSITFNKYPSPLETRVIQSSITNTNATLVGRTKATLFGTEDPDFEEQNLSLEIRGNQHLSTTLRRQWLWDTATGPTPLSYKAKHNYDFNGSLSMDDKNSIYSWSVYSAVTFTGNPGAGHPYSLQYYMGPNTIPIAQTAAIGWFQNGGTDVFPPNALAFDKTATVALDSYSEAHGVFIGNYDLIPLVAESGPNTITSLGIDIINVP